MNKSIVAIALVAVGCRGHRDEGITIDLASVENTASKSDPPPAHEGTTMGLESPAQARQAAIAQARSVGILGSTALRHGGAFASLTGTGDASSGFDGAHIYGPLIIHTGHVELVVAAYDTARRELDRL